jgi:hypothetical protein
MNKKTIAKMLGIMVGASTVVGAFAANAANGDPMLINPNEINNTITSTDAL